MAGLIAGFMTRHSLATADRVITPHPIAASPPLATQLVPSAGHVFFSRFLYISEWTCIEVTTGASLLLFCRT